MRLPSLSRIWATTHSRQMVLGLDDRSASAYTTKNRVECIAIEINDDAIACWLESVTVRDRSRDAGPLVGKMASSPRGLMDQRGAEDRFVKLMALGKSAANFKPRNRGCYGFRTVGMMSLLG